MTENNCNFVTFSTKAYLLNPQNADLFELESSSSVSSWNQNYLPSIQFHGNTKQSPDNFKSVEIDNQFLPQCIKNSTQKSNLTKIQEDQLANKLEQVMKHINQEAIDIQSIYKLEVQKLKNTLGIKQKLLQSQTSKINSFRCQNQLLRNQLIRLKQENTQLKQKYDELFESHQKQLKIKRVQARIAQDKNNEGLIRKNKTSINNNHLYLSQLTKQSKLSSKDQQELSRKMSRDLNDNESLIQSHIEKLNSLNKLSRSRQQSKIESFSQTFDEKGEILINRNMIQPEFCQISKITKKKYDTSFEDNLSWVKFVKNEVSQTNFQENDDCYDEKMKKKIQKYILQIRKDFNLEGSKEKSKSKHKRKRSTLRNFNK